MSATAPAIYALPDANKFIVLYEASTGQVFRKDVDTAGAKGGPHRKFLAIAQAVEQMRRDVLATEGKEQ